MYCENTTSFDLQQLFIQEWSKCFWSGKTKSSIIFFLRPFVLFFHFFSDLRCVYIVTGHSGGQHTFWYFHQVKMAEIPSELFFTITIFNLNCLCIYLFQCRQLNALLTALTQTNFNGVHFFIARLTLFWLGTRCHLSPAVQ